MYWQLLVGVKKGFCSPPRLEMGTPFEIAEAPFEIAEAPFEIAEAPFEIAEAWIYVRRCAVDRKPSAQEAHESYKTILLLGFGDEGAHAIS